MLIHADRFSFQVTDRTNVAGFVGDLAPGEERASLEDVLVAFVSVEKADESGPHDVAEQAAMQIRATADKLGATRVMVYPYAHLSSDLAKPRIAIGVLGQVADLICDESGLEVHRAPFGYYKSYDIACKGHPLSELAMTVLPGVSSDRAEGQATRPAVESKAIAAEKTLRSEWRIYQPDGAYVLADDFDFTSHPGLKDLFTYERSGTRVAEEAPPHIKLMREHELVDYEPASDTGNLRWYPQGLQIKRLLEQRVTGMVVDYGAMEVETPIMYDYGHPALSKYLHRFPARQYVVRSENKEFFLRFAACFGQYMIMNDMVASHRDLPVRLYELTHFSFRREQGGEVAGLRRLRSFTMPDMHSLVRDMEMAKQEFLDQVSLCLDWLDDTGLNCVPAIRFVRSFLDEHPDFIEQLMRRLRQPALIEVWDERFFYFVAKFEMNFIDSGKKAACLSTVQIDVENAERFDITYMAEDGTKQRPLLLHTSVSGSLDRNVYAILETQAMRMARGEKAQWPVWLAPIQARLVPVTGAHVEGAMRLAERLPYRVDVDDRDIKLGKKIREAEKEWIPYVLVVGERELAGGDLTIRTRQGSQLEMSFDAFLEQLATETAGKPQRPANTPRAVSKRPIFVG
ncbi:threonine--tRNA ligase [Micromonospora qiuiae]|uniref:Threonine--tRNA ligase n=1 Tax=Micromonospora qiuiae TaxID=502268 RepID=A0ABQ4JIF7_9ACTN|nr:threonine--tRNA ligase [Micromonospora qiuiae]GIJ29235.1 threonine--tRNA ligase [Micromonospora qiuiae]